VQDEIALRDNLGLTLGLKIEDHTYTEIEYMPNVRLAWQPGRHSLIWAAVSRAVRTPSRIDRELVNPGVVIPGEFRSEDLLAYEIGYRGQPASNWAVAANLYHHEYDNVRTLNFTPPGVLPVQYGNGLSGHVQGLELWSDVDVTADWRLSAGLTLLDQEFTADPLTIDFNGTGFDPEYQVFVRSYIDIANTFDLNLFLRAIDEVHPQVPAYVELDATLGWRFGDFDLALVGRNLLDESHPESFNGQTPQEARRSLQLSATITY
jgi:iron complex outermembrane receptor protein